MLQTAIPKPQSAGTSIQNLFHPHLLYLIVVISMCLIDLTMSLDTSLNGDIGGIMLRNNVVYQPWFSPAGSIRGALNNVSCCYNPTKAQRDYFTLTESIQLSISSFWNNPIW